MYKAIILDMDGTIADLYSVSGWLDDLKTQNARPYRIARAMYNTNELNAVLDECRAKGYRIVITTWLAKDSTREYKKEVASAKAEWLKANGIRIDEIHFYQYGRTKADATRKHGGYQILVDDNEKIRKGWHLGNTINANENIIEALKKVS